MGEPSENVVRKGQWQAAWIVMTASLHLLFLQRITLADDTSD
jgi:hypothetical protein